MRECVSFRNWTLTHSIFLFSKLSEYQDVRHILRTATVDGTKTTPESFKS